VLAVQLETESVLTCLGCRGIAAVVAAWNLGAPAFRHLGRVGAIKLHTAVMVRQETLDQVAKQRT